MARAKHERTTEGLGFKKSYIPRSEVAGERVAACLHLSVIASICHVLSRCTDVNTNTEIPPA
jgi:hypothetical protein